MIVASNFDIDAINLLKTKKNLILLKIPKKKQKWNLNLLYLVIFINQGI